MRSDTKAFDFIDQKTAETMVNICFTVKDLKHQLNMEQFAKMKKIIHADVFLHNELEGLLTSQDLQGFTNALKTFRKGIGELKELTSSLEVGSLEKEQLENTLKNLKSQLTEVLQEPNTRKNSS